MATAPPIGAVERTVDGPDSEDAAAAWIEVTVKAPNPIEAELPPFDRPYRVHPLTVSLRHEAIFTKATGFPWEKVVAEMDSFGIVGVAAVWYMARLVSGEWPLTWERVSEQWPTTAEFAARVTVDAGVEGADSPEA